MTKLIDWQMILEGYNDTFGTAFDTVGSMLGSLYGETRSAWRMEEVLGVCSSTIRNEMRRAGIEIQPRGGDPMARAPKKRKILEILGAGFEQMPHIEIARQAGCSPCWVCLVCQQEIKRRENG